LNAAGGLLDGESWRGVYNSKKRGQDLNTTELRQDAIICPDPMFPK